MQILLSNTHSTEIDSCLQSTTVQVQELDKFYMQDCVWSVVPLTHTKNKLVPWPSCDCGEFESPYHFLFRCHRFTAVRNIYLSDYKQTHFIHNLLHGKDTATGWARWPI